MTKALTSYRPDVDGLRAVAVLAVIVHHIDRSLLPGGFVGVDIFFVISGYLITRNIVVDIEAGRFWLLDFFQRRVRRIAPAMLLVVATTLLAAQLLLMPRDAERVADSAVWSVFSLANVYFWRSLDAGYFAESSALVPLLHLWSLGVEEQFYLLWPILLMLGYRSETRRYWPLLAVLAAGASFWAAEQGIAWDPSFVYYMLPTRAGELLLGALIALDSVRANRRTVSPGVSASMAAAGVALIAGLYVSDQTSAVEFDRR